MMDEARGVMKLKPADGPLLQEKAAGGDHASVRRFVLFSAWRQIQGDRGIPPKKKASVFRELVNAIDILVVSNGG